MANYNTTIQKTYDQAVFDWAGQATWDDEAVPRCFSSPDRAFGMMARVLGVDVKAVPQPFVSIYAHGPTPDITRFNNHPIRHLGYADDAETQRWVADWPVPVEIGYDLTVWARNILDVRSIIQQWHAPFRGVECFVTCVIDDVQGTKIIPLINPTATDQSRLEPGEDPRQLRYQFSFTMRAWYFKRPTQVREIELVEVTYEVGE